MQHELNFSLENICIELSLEKAAYGDAVTSLTKVFSLFFPPFSHQCSLAICLSCFPRGKANSFLLTDKSDNLNLSTKLSDHFMI